MHVLQLKKNYFDGREKSFFRKTFAKKALNVYLFMHLLLHIKYQQSVKIYQSHTTHLNMIFFYKN